MDVSQLALSLQRTLSSDAAERIQAADFLNRAFDSDYYVYARGLMAIFLDESWEESVRVSSGIAVKNAFFVGRDKLRMQRLLGSKWRSLQISQRSELAELGLQTLQVSNRRLSSLAAQIYASIVCVDIAFCENDNPLRRLFATAGVSNGSDGSRRAACEALGLICEISDLRFLQNHSNDLTGTVINGINYDTASSLGLDIRFTCLKSFAAVVPLISHIIGSASERDFILVSLYRAMSLFVESPKEVALKLCTAGWDCYTKLLEYYYPNVAPYFLNEQLLSFAVLCLKSSDPYIAMSTIEFWSSLAELESEFSSGSENESLNVVAKSLHLILSQLLQLSCREHLDDNDEDEWTPRMAALTCLTLISGCTGPQLSKNDFYMQFVQACLTSQNLALIESGIMILGSTIDSLDVATTKSLISSSLVHFLQLFDSKVSSVIDDSLSWFIAKLCDTQYKLLADNELVSIISSFHRKLAEAPASVATNCVWGIMNMLTQIEADCKSGQVRKLDLLKGNLIHTFSCLFKLQQRSDFFESNLYTATYQTLHNLLEECPPEFETFLQTLYLEVCNTLSRSNLRDPILTAGNLSALEALIFKVASSVSFQELGQILAAYLRADNDWVLEEDFRCILACFHQKILYDQEDNMGHLISRLRELASTSQDPQILTILLSFLNELAAFDNCELAQRVIVEMLQPVFNILALELSENVLFRCVSFFSDLCIHHEEVLSSHVDFFLQLLAVVIRCALENAQESFGDPDIKTQVIESAASLVSSIVILISEKRQEHLALLLQQVLHFSDTLIQLTRDRSFLDAPSIYEHLFGLLGDTICSCSNLLFKHLAQYPHVVSLLSRVSQDTSSNELWCKQVLQEKHPNFLFNQG